VRFYKPKTRIHSSLARIRYIQPGRGGKGCRVGVFFDTILALTC
jgi:hypothetical protein